MKRNAKLLMFCTLLLAALLLCACATQDPSGKPQADTRTAQPTDAQPEAVEVELIADTPVPATPMPTPTPTEVPTPTPTPEPTPTPTPDHYGVLSATLSDKLSFDGVIDTDDTYRDEGRCITVTKVDDDPRTGRTLTYFIVDIYLTDPTDLRRVQAKGTALKDDKIAMTDIAQRENTIIAMSGDHTSTEDKGLVIIDGETVYNSKKFKRDLLVLYRDGVMAAYAPDEIDPDMIEAREPWASWSFGPNLLERDGTPKTKFNLPDHIGERNPRAAIGYFEPGHYCFVLVDGRQDGYSQGLNLEELAALMQELGCKVAYNLDGGISAQLTWHGQMINKQAKKRSVCDIVCISYPPKEP